MVELIPVLDENGQIVLNGNTFGTLEEANAYFASRPNGEGWVELGQDGQATGLLSVMDILGDLNWIGGLVREDQPGPWPRVAIRPVERRSQRRIRTGLETLTGATGGLYDLKNRFWAATAIPTPVKNAQFELAFALQVDGFNFDGDAEVKSLTDDKFSATFDRPTKR